MARMGILSSSSYISFDPLWFLLYPYPLSRSSMFARETLAISTISLHSKDSRRSNSSGCPQPFEFMAISVAEVAVAFPIL